jgi:hypothetical protein
LRRVEVSRALTSNTLVELVSGEEEDWGIGREMERGNVRIEGLCPWLILGKNCGF